VSRPVIGITTYVEPARWGSWDRDAALLPQSYVAAVVAAGGVPVLLPPVPDAAAAVIATLDGLLVSGGADVDPSRYGQAAHETTDRPRTDRDSWESDLLRLALESRIPVLAICRGLQVLNVALGGTLHQHLPDVCGHEGHRPVPGTYGTTTVGLVAGTRVATILGSRAPTGVAAEVDVPCHHHQAVDRAGDGLVVSGRAADGTIEAMELDDADRWVVAVQWHPEDGTDPRLFEAFVAEAARSGGDRRASAYDSRRQDEEGSPVS
jgi:gamma-glutamyl-gamma-aminobutyrate hydrolase PuuD